MLSTGCGDGIRQPSVEQLAVFESGQSAGPAVDLNGVVQARIPTGPYRVVPGDVLQLEIPRAIDPQSPEVTAAAEARQVCTCRVSDEGTIVLPIVGPFAAAGKSLAQIEAGIISQYYPKYIKSQLPVYVRIVEYKTYRVSVVGAVARPGVYAMRHDQMSLVALLMEAGSIAESGAALIRINRVGANGLHIPSSSDTVLSGGQTRRVPAWVRAVFEQEGPLPTTGWLALAEDDGVLTRRWLDLGSEHQRQAFLQAAPARVQWIEQEGLRDRLLYLAGYLDSLPESRGQSAVPEDAGWYRADGGSFVASFPVSPLGRARCAEPRLLSDRATTVNVVLPVRGLNIPFADVALQEGDSVVVEGPPQQFVSVVGLVTHPGNMPYPPNGWVTLIQAIAFAGGLDLVADPRYIGVYRLKADGRVASATFKLVNPKNQEQLTQALALPLQPGDVVSVEATPRTRTNVLLDRLFRVNLGLYANPESLWND